MKNIKLLIAMIFMATFAQAQNFVEVKEATYNGFSEKEESVFSVEVNRVTRKDLLESWQKFLAAESDYKPEATETRLTVKKVVLKSITTKPLNFYLQFEDMENGVRVFIGVQDSIDGFIGPNHPVYGLSLSGMIKEHSTKVYLNAKEGDIDKEKKTLKGLQKELKSAIKDREKISKNIVKNQRDIDNLKQEITYNTGLLESMQKLVTTKKMELSTLPASTTKEAKKAVKQEMNAAEKEYKSTMKAIDKATEDVFDEEAEIREMKMELQAAENEVADIQKRVNEQDEFVRSLQNQVYQAGKK